MNGKGLEVVRWVDNGSKSCNTIWKGESEQEAIVIAAYEYCKEIVTEQCFAQRLLSPWEQKIDMRYANKVKARFTVLEVLDPRREAAGEKPVLIASFGDESIQMFQRYDFT